MYEDQRYVRTTKSHEQQGVSSYWSRDPEEIRYASTHAFILRYCHVVHVRLCTELWHGGFWLPQRHDISYNSTYIRYSIHCLLHKTYHSFNHSILIVKDRKTYSREQKFKIDIKFSKK